MRVFESDSIRNICIVGHGAAGKTSLTSAMLFDFRGRQPAGPGRRRQYRHRLGRRGNRTQDQHQLRSGSLRVEQEKDQHPGHSRVIGRSWRETRACCARGGCGGGRGGCGCRRRSADREGMGILRRVFPAPDDRDQQARPRQREQRTEPVHPWKRPSAVGAVPLQIPIGAERDFSGVVSILTNKAYRYARDGSGKFQEDEIPAQYKDEVGEDARQADRNGRRRAATTLMEKFFAEGTLDQAELIEGLKASILQRIIVPCFLYQLDIQYRHRPDPGYDCRICFPSPAPSAR